VLHMKAPRGMVLEQYYVPQIHLLLRPNTFLWEKKRKRKKDSQKNVKRSVRNSVHIKFMNCYSFMSHNIAHWEIHFTHQISPLFKKKIIINRF